MLGPVDGFDQDEGGGEGDERAEVGGGFFAAQGDAFEAFELPDGLFDGSVAKFAWLLNCPQDVERG